MQSLIIYLPPAIEQRLIMYSLASVCLFVIHFCKQDISEDYLLIFTKFIADTPYTLPWK